MRYSMHFIVILIALSLIRDCEPDEIVAWDVPRRFCSSDIPNIMRLVCRPRTRNLPLRWNKNTTGKQYISDRQKRGIVDDCCKKPCTPLYIQEYCHSDFEKTSTNVVLLYTSRQEYTISTTTTTTTTPTPTTSTTTVASAPLKLCYPQISITWQ